MKLLYIVHQFYPEFAAGTEKFVFNVASALQRDGHSVHVVTYTFQEQDLSRDGDWLVRDYLYRTIPVTAVRHTQVPIDINSAWAGPELMQLAENLLGRLRPDVVHIAHPMRAGAFAEAATKLHIPYVITLTDFWTICPKITLQTSGDRLCAGPRGGDECARLCPELDQSSVRARLERTKRVFENAKTVVAPSHFVASIFRAEFPDLKVLVIPHGIRRPRLAPQPKTYRKGDKLVFGYAGGLAPHKGVHILIKAFRQMNAAAELRIYGTHFHQPDYFELLQAIADGDPHIRFCATYSDQELDRIFQELDILVLPSLWYETYSFSAREALARGIPVIGSHLGAIQEVVHDGVSGFTFPVGDVEELKRTLERVAVNPKQFEAIKANLVSHVAPAPMVEEEAYLYERIYQRH